MSRRPPAVARAGHHPSSRRGVILHGPRGERLSALLAEPSQPPRGTLVALHGAGLNARYFTDHALPGSSFADVATSLGFTVLCVDRPGYGTIATSTGPGYQLGEQVEILSWALRRFVDTADLGDGLGLLAHSFGGKVALGLAASGYLADSLVSLDVSGCGARLAASTQVAVGSFVSNSWGPRALYPPGTFQVCRDLAADVPPAELAAAGRWPTEFPRVAQRVRVPVRLTFAEHERWWRHGPADLAELREHFRNAPRVVLDQQLSAGHNISLGLAARAYHLKALAFFEESLLDAA
ncbi:MAG: alpha/beta hydrolase [Dermatophilaceae bacterium]